MNDALRPLMLILAACILLGLPLPAAALEGAYDSGTGTAAVLLTSVDPPDAAPVLLPVSRHPDPAVFRQAFEAQRPGLYTATGRTSGGLPVKCAVEYDFSAAVPSPRWGMPSPPGGQGTLPGRLLPPAGYAFAEDVAYALPFCLLQPKRIDLSNYEVTPSGDIRFEWIYPIPPTERRGLQYIFLEGTSYQPDTAGYFGRVEATSLLLYRDRLPAWSVFRIVQDGLPSNCVSILFADGAPSVSVSRTFPEPLPNLGDQDGGDRDEQSMPPLNQTARPSEYYASACSDAGRGGGSGSAGAGSGKAPGAILRPPIPPAPAGVPPAAPNTADEPSAFIIPEPTADNTALLTDEPPVPAGAEPPDAIAGHTAESEKTVTEYVTENSTALTGFRIRQLVERNGFAAVEKHGILIRLPGELFQSLADDGLAEITLVKTSETSFSLSILLAGAPVSGMPPAEVQFPLAEEPANGPVTVSGAVDADCIPEGGLVTFQITRTGSYRVEPWARAASAGARPALPQHPAASFPGAAPAVCAAALCAAVRIAHERKRQ